MRKSIAFLLLIVLAGQLLTGCAGAPLTAPERERTIDLSYGFIPSESKGELEKVSENDRFILYVNFANGEAAVEDKQEGKTWYTNPVDRAEDGLASGFNKNALQSAITVVYTTNLSVEMICGGFMSSVRKDGLSYRVEDDGSVIFQFDFPNEAFSIPVRYAIGEEGFTAEILSYGIREYGTNAIKSIDLLPFFGAGGTEDAGYMLVPDGSGALIYYNNRSAGSTYSKPLYGFDNGTNDKLSGAVSFTTYCETQYLPVFGVHQNDQGFLAIISEGSARAVVNANVSYKYTLYNTVWSTYQYRSIGTVYQTQKDGSLKVTSVPEKKIEDWENFRVDFHFLGTEGSEYPDMAAAYREYLVKTWGLEQRVTEQEEIPLYLDLYGYIKKTKSFLGIPMQKKISMTTIEDINDMLDELEQAGIFHVVAKYNYWAKDSYFDKIPTKAGVDGKVGSASQLKALQDRLANNGGGLYLAADLLNVYKTGNGISQYGDVLRSVANTSQRQYRFALDLSQVDSRYRPWYLLRPTVIPETFDRFADSLTAAGYENLALDSVGEMLYSELSGDGVGRNQALAILRDAVKAVGEKAQGLMVTGANAYAASQANHILRSPSKASCYDLENVSVPFYQMVYHGYISYSLDATNLASNPADATLTYLEYGAYPLFSLIGENADELIGSRMDGLYSADAANWMDFLVAQYGLLNETLGRVQTSTITGHRIVSEDVRVVSYDNGIQIYVNYGDKAAGVDGVSIQAKGYAVIKDGTVLTSGQAADL